jgi:hypothetical protein
VEVNRKFNGQNPPSPGKEKTSAKQAAGLPGLVSNEKLVTRTTGNLRANPGNPEMRAIDNSSLNQCNP